jgi:hypothetical protein
VLIFGGGAKREGKEGERETEREKEKGGGGGGGNRNNVDASLCTYLGLKVKIRYF